jgi:hypothetical protein
MGYSRTLIAVADDCPVTSSVVPTARGAKKTVAVLQYEMIGQAPYRFTQEDVLFETWVRQQELVGAKPTGSRDELRRQFFATPRACLRASPLPKRYGWGLHFDDEGRVALCPIESEEYRRLRSGELAGLEVLKAFRSSKA